MEKKIPTTSGVYFVRIKGESLISVNADRPSRRGSSIKVNSSNCKYGRAVNLNRRFRDYQKTFGSDRVMFSILAVTVDFVETERVLCPAPMICHVPVPTLKAATTPHGLPQ